MADIQSYLDKIRTAESGESVRDAIINSLRDINNDDPNPRASSATFDMPVGSDLHMTGGPWNEITVRQAGSGGKTTNLRELTITENGVFPRDDPDYDPDTERVYYSKVTSKVPQMGSAIMEDVFEVTENGQVYYAENEGVDGFAAIKVNVSNIPVSGQFEVKFYDSDNVTLLETQLVPAYGSAEFGGTYPTSPIGPFTGWNPSPVNVTKDMKCYPKFGQIIVDPTEITDGWDVICANRGVGYPLGSHKLLAYGATFTPDEVRTWYPSYQQGNIAFNAYMMMYKVAEGEGNSHSSWLSGSVNFSAIPGLFNPGHWVYQTDTGLRKFLNGALYNHCAQIFKDTIIPVTKYSLNKQDVAIPTEDKIWLPGTSEVGTYQTKYGDIYDFLSANTWDTSKRYCQVINILDSVSKKYVRDYLNNDRNYPIAFANNYNSSESNHVCLRDCWGNTVYNTVYYIAGSIVYNTGEAHFNNRINIGFCL